jgi:pimeloyl-ACP methyl ester carboxylesterase
MIGLGGVLGRPSPGVAGAPPDAPPPGSSRAARGPWSEAWGGLQLVRLICASPWLAAAPRGDGGLVVDLPGWRAPEASNAPLRAYLRLLGHDARGWGGGTNTGAVVRDVERLVKRFGAAGAPERVTLLGWSLGGVIAREVARELPNRVAQVVTFGTPVVGGPTYTAAAASYGAAESRRIATLAARRDAERPIAVPITAIYTRRDGVVDWRACIDRVSPAVRHVEVRSTHLSLGVDPDVWWTIARALAPAGARAAA